MSHGAKSYTGALSGYLDRYAEGGAGDVRKARRARASFRRSPPKFLLLSQPFYERWCAHRREVKAAKAVIDNRVPTLNPETTFRAIRLNPFAYRFEKTLNTDKQLLRRINYLQRTGGLVDCWNKSQTESYMRYMYLQRQGNFKRIRKENLLLYKRFAEARSDQYTTSELDKRWKVVQDQVRKGAQLPFVLFEAERIDRGMKDVSFERPPNFHRPRASMEIWVVGGCKMGKITIELFTDIVPQTCQLFLSLIKGSERGYSYKGTRIFGILPNLYCRGGDVCKDNGFGCYDPPGEDAMAPESFALKHSIPGVMSMVVNESNELNGQFNIVFKPLPQLDGKHTVFGRIVADHGETLTRISAQGLPQGVACTDIVVRECGWYTRAGRYRSGKPNTIKFPSGS